MQIFANNAFSTLAGAATNVATTLSVQPGQGARFPAPTGGDFFLLTLFELIGGLEANHEIVKVTARSIDILTVVRAQESTTASAWGVGSQASHRGTAGTLGGLAQLGAPATFTQPVYAPTAAPGTNTTQSATTAFVGAAVAQGKADLVASSPAALDTLNEFALALGNDANFAATTATALGNRLRVDVGTQNLSALQKANAATNLGLAAVAGTGSKADVGLGNVDNTSDVSKPVSAAQQTALDLKANAASPAFTGTPTGITKTHVGLGNVDNTTDAAKPVSTAQAAALALKADLLYVENALAISGAINDIGVQGLRGFGVGICPALPTGFSALNGTYNKFSDNYGNYQFSDSSIMVWMPAFFYKYNADNTAAILPRSAYATVAAANTAGYALHRAFYNSGLEQRGVFVDKYACSNNNGIASSIRGKNPLSSYAGHNPFSALTGAPPNFYYGAIAAVKTRGAKFFCNSRFIFSALSMLSLAHGQSANANSCAWYDAAGITNYPKGCNSNALGDTNDATLAFASNGYSNAAQTGSANVLAKTTHNGQGSGVADLNGGMWEINLGMTSDGAQFYLLKTAADISAITGGNTLATDAWGAPGIAAMYDSIGATYGALTASSTVKSFGSAAQVLSAATSGTAWSATGAGIPLLAGVGGANKFGSDFMADYRPNEMCPIAGGGWGNGAIAGVWALEPGNVRGSSNDAVGCRAALYL